MQHVQNEIETEKLSFD